MKKIFIMQLIAFSFLQTNAQKHIGVKLGYNNSDAKYYPGDIIHKSISGFQFGSFGEFNLNKFLLLKSNILFTQKGNYGDNSAFSSAIYERSTFRLSFLELDISLACQLAVSSKAKINFGIGPYFGVGLFGRDKGASFSNGNIGIINTPVKFSNTMKADFTGPYFKPFDYGLNYNCSVNFYKCILYLNYSNALISRLPFNGKDRTSKNQVYSVGIGYYIR